MLASFTSLFDLFEAFPDEQACIDHLRSIRWRDGEFCPYCGDGRVYHFSDRKTAARVAWRQVQALRQQSAPQGQPAPLLKYTS